MNDPAKKQAQLAAETAAARRSRSKVKRATPDSERAEASLRQNKEKGKQVEADPGSLALFPSENPNPILRISTNGMILYANEAASGLLDFWQAQVGRPAPRPLHQMVLEAVRSGSTLESEVRCRDKVFSFGSSLIADRAYVNLYGRDVTAHKRAEAELRELNRTLHAHTRSAHAMMRARNEAEYLQEVCNIVVEDCGHAMVWIGYAEDDAGKTVRPVVHFGFDEGYLEKLNVTWADTERGRGPTGTAIRTGKLCVCRNILTDPALAPWRAEAQKRGYASSVAVPLTADGKAFGAMTIYAREPDAFSDDETMLLSALADDMAFGITSLRLREAHGRAEDDVRRSRDELELRVRERTRELTEANRRLSDTNLLLELFAKAGSRQPYLDSVVEMLARISGCSSVGIRVLNERGEVPYQASIGFSEEFLKSECWLSVERDFCACTRIALDRSEPQDGPVLTPKGSFLCRNLFEFIGALSPVQQARFRGACLKAGYATLAVLPLRHRGKVIGVIHFADPAPDKAERDTVDFLESMAPLIAETVYRFKVEETLRDSEARARAIFDHAFQFVALVRLDGTVLEVNQPALDFAGIALADVRDRPLWEANWWSASPEGQKQLKSAVADAAAGRFVRYEVALRGAGDAVIVADFSMKPVLDGQGKVSLLIAEARDITDRKRLEREIRETAAREQRRIGQDLHDALGQNLAGVAMLSRTLEKKLAARSLREADEAAKIAELAGQAAAQSREIARGLHPVEISEDGLMHALRELAANTQNLFGIPCEFRCDAPAPVRDNNVATQFYYIAQEAVNNAVKHSGAKKIVVSLNRSPEMISLRIRDDGTGLPPNIGTVDGMGLRIMRYRAEAIGGFLDVRSVPPRGTMVGCHVRSAGPNASEAGAQQG